MEKFFERRATCIMCLKMPYVPLDINHMNTPENCTSRFCDNMFEKKKYALKIEKVDSKIEKMKIKMSQCNTTSVMDIEDLFK